MHCVSILQNGHFIILVVIVSVETQCIASLLCNVNGEMSRSLIENQPTTFSPNFPNKTTSVETRHVP